MAEGGSWTADGISVVTVCYNSAGTIEDAIRSINTQTISVDHVIVDGVSSDGTLEIVRKHRNQIGRLLVEQDAGIYDAVNKGIVLAESAIVGVLHADDFFSDDHVLEDILGAFSSNSIDAVYGDVEFVDKSHTDKIMRRWQPGEYSQARLYHGWMPPHPTFFVRRECYEKYGLYRLDLGTAADYELMLRFLLVHGIRVKYIPRVLVKMRVGGASNANLAARLRANRMDRKAWAVNGLRPYPWTLLAKPLRKLPQWWVR